MPTLPDPHLDSQLEPLTRTAFDSTSAPREHLKSLIAFDVECTGLSGAPHLLELGAVRIEDGEVQDHFQSLVAAPVAIEQEAFELHGIDEALVRSAPFASQVLAEFFAWVGESVLIAHNAGVDAHVLGYECARANIPAPRNDIFDSLALARRAWPGAPDHRLETLVEYLGLEAEVMHRALTDAMACWQVACASLEQLGSGDQLTHGQLCSWSKRPTSVAARMPLRPSRKPSILRKIEQAKLEGRHLQFLYGDRITQPARLEVLPRLLFRNNQHDYLEGECRRSGTLKTYRVDRILKVETNN